MFKILVATDGSSFADKAADFAGVLARKIGEAEITVLSVLDPGLASQAAISPAGMPVTIPINLTEDMQNVLKRVLQETQQRLITSGRPVNVQFEQGKPARVIRAVAEGDGFDLIVMGASGHGRIADILMGSVSDEVVHKSAIPVLIVPSKEDRR